MTEMGSKPSYQCFKPVLWVLLLGLASCTKEKILVLVSFTYCLKIPCRWLLLDKLRPHARLSLHFTGITCSAFHSWFNICFPTNKQWGIPPRQISSLQQGNVRLSSWYCITPRFLENKAELGHLLWGTSLNVYKAVTSGESLLKLVSIYGTSVAQSFPTACSIYQPLYELLIPSSVTQIHCHITGGLEETKMHLVPWMKPALREPHLPKNRPCCLSPMFFLPHLN